MKTLWLIIFFPVICGLVFWVCSKNPTSSTLQSIEISPASTSMLHGGSRQFTAQALYADGGKSIITSSSTWSVDPTSAGNFISEGLFTPTTCYTGSAAVTASYEGFQDQASVTIKGYEMVHIPAGEFIMGSDSHVTERPIHTVYLDAYTIDKYEVTNFQYAAFLISALNEGIIQIRSYGVYKDGKRLISLDEDECQINYLDGQFIIDNGKGDYPVIGITWFGADEYAKYNGNRLPTEAEWEKAARGTDQRQYPWGYTGPTQSHSNFNSNLGGTTSVGQYSPTGDSPYGCCDMAGNVLEWCADWFGYRYYETLGPYCQNPQGPAQGDEDTRVLRGGGWKCNGCGHLRCAGRGHNYPDLSCNEIGFRCVRSDQ